MNQQIPIQHLRKFLKTETDASELTTLLTKVHANLFKNSSPFLAQLDQELPYDVKQAILPIINEVNVLVSDKEEAEKFIKLLKEVIDDLPRVQITFAYFPKEDTIEKISEWFMTNFKKVVVTQIEVDHTLIGGSIVAFNGKYKDYSIKNMLPNLAVH